ncbi:MAG: 4-aminobutyrate aminotransferase-like enzyme [Lysobacterales bacterium]
MICSNNARKNHNVFPVESTPPVSEINQSMNMISTENLIERRNNILGKAYSLFYERPLHLVKGEGVWLIAADGRRYLDAYNNVPHVGHCHPHVVEAICRQAATLNTHTRYLHETILDYAEMLTARFSEGLDVAMFSCTGTEANELALRIARAHSGGSGMIVTPFAYHGNSWAVSQITTSDLPEAEREDNVVTVPAPDVYSGQYRGEDACEQYLMHVHQAVELLKSRGHRPAAMIVDTVFSSEGVPNVPAGYLAGAADIVREAGGLFIADEVQPGFGRTGLNFWGFENHGLVPDIVTMGKPMGNGHPISAVVTTTALVDQFQQQAEYFNTFGGNPVSCAAAKAVLEVMDAENLQANALAVGRHLHNGLRALADRHEMIGDVRGSGLFNAVELVRNRESREAADTEAVRVVNEMRDRGVLISETGPRGNVLKIRGPMTFSKENADFLIEKLDESLQVVNPS